MQVKPSDSQSLAKFIEEHNKRVDEQTQRLQKEIYRALFGTGDVKRG